jgi:hypothetical protein
MSQITCNLCGRALDVHASYVVRIDVFAEPTMPPVTEDEIQSGDLTAAMDELLKQMEDMSAEELEESVHRRFEYRLCPACQRLFLANPLGKPRQFRTMHN